MLIMRFAATKSLPAWLRAFALSATIAVGLASTADRPGFSEETVAYEIQVSDVTGKVGEHVVMQARLRQRLLRGHAQVEQADQLKHDL